MKKPAPKKSAPKPTGPDPKVALECACGKTHRLARKDLLTGLGVKRRKCKNCQQRFVVACVPGDDQNPESFWPLYLDQVPSLGDTQEVGIATEPVPMADVPSELHFKCRCGCRLVGKPHMYGKPTRCPKCGERIIVTPAFDDDTGAPVARVDYPDRARKR